MREASEQDSINRVLPAIQAIREGRMVIMVDDEDRENEGDLVFAAEHVTPEKINFMAREGRGLICLTLAPNIVEQLKLPLIRELHHDPGAQSTAFTVSIEARHGVTTGISAADRAKTVLAAISPDARPEDLVTPGHMFPLRAVEGGVLQRAGHTEGSVDIAQMAGCRQAGVICEIMNDDGTMARLSDLRAFSQKHGLPIVSIADLITYRLLNESLVEQVSCRTYELPELGSCASYLFKSIVDNQLHMAVCVGLQGDSWANEIVNVRVHNAQPFSDIFEDLGHRGRKRLHYGMEMLKLNKPAVFLYLRKEKTPDQIRSDYESLFEDSTSPQDSHASDSAKVMDQRTIGVGAQILKFLKVNKMRLHLRSPQNLKGLRGFGLEIVNTEIID